MEAEFGLERVLRYRRQKEEELAVQLARLEESYRQALEKLRKLQGEQLELQAQWKKTVDSGPVLPTHLYWHDLYLRSVEDKIRYQAMQVSGLGRDIENKRAELLEAMKERKKLEKLKEEWHRRMLQEQAKIEEKATDEVGTSIYNRKRITA